MKTQAINRNGLYYIFFIGIIIFSSCSKKENSLNTSTSATTASVNTTQAIGVGVSWANNDSIYVVGTCDYNHHLDSVAVANLPSAITSYLDSTYSGYTMVKAFTDNDQAQAVTGYVVIINYNNTPVGLKFDASGSFVKVLEQREGRDLRGRGWHHGGCFDDRDGMQRDTVDLSSLPASITTYFASDYPQDTLVKAYKNSDSTYIIFSVNNGVYATTFTADGTFINHVKLQPHQSHERVFPIPDTSLLPSINTYLTNTYPGYVLKQSFAIGNHDAITGYIVAINSSGTNYAVLFDASGAFVTAAAIH